MIRDNLGRVRKAAGLGGGGVSLWFNNPLTLCSPPLHTEIVDGNAKMTLGMIWTIILRFAIQDISVEGKAKSPPDSKEPLFLPTLVPPELWRFRLGFWAFCLNASRLILVCGVTHRAWPFAGAVSRGAGPSCRGRGVPPRSLPE